MNRIYFLYLNIFFLLLFAGCSGIPVKTGDNIIEEDFSKYSFVSNEDLQKAIKKEKLSIDDVYVLAVDRTEKLAIEYAALKETQNEKLKAYSLFLPKISFRYQQNFLSSDSSGPWMYFYAKQPLFSGMKEVYGFDKINANIQLKEALLKYRAQRLYLEIANAFYSALTAEEDLRSKQYSLELLKERLIELKKRKSVGKSKESEVLSALSQEAMLKADIEEKLTDYKEAREELIYLAGLSDNFLLDDLLPENISENAKLLLEKNNEIQIKKRYDIMAAKEMVFSAEADLKTAYAAYLPQIYLQGSYYLKKGDARVEAQSGADNDYSIQLSAEAPLFQGGELLAEMKSAKIRKEKAELSYNESIRLANAEAAKAKINLSASLRKINAYKEAYEIAQKNYKIQDNEYKRGLVTNLDVLTALNELETAKIKYYKSKTDIILNSIWYQIASGIFLDKNIAPGKNSQ
ncbi:MAG: TolC family protein [Spirochaetia bacterium]|nr:TolC family protein [Spirochaetia bacterium]